MRKKAIRVLPISFRRNKRQEEIRDNKSKRQETIKVKDKKNKKNIYYTKM